MHRQLSVYRFPNSDKGLFIQVILTLVVINLGLRLLRFRKLNKIISRYSQGNIDPINYQKISINQIVLSIDHASKWFMGAASCFPQALTGKIFLERFGYPVKLIFGVKTIDHNKLRAHAWLEYNGEVIIGGPRSLIEQFTPLTDLEKVSY
jgi:hypothetical protein